MKKILISIVILFAAIVTMAYLYFSRLNTDQNTTDMGLHAAAASSGFIFSFQNDKGVTDILKEQQLFEEILGTDKYKLLRALKKYLLNLPGISQALDQQKVYISFRAGDKQEIDFFFSTQLGSQQSIKQLFASLQAGKIQAQTAKEISRLILPDSTVFYLGLKQDLAILSHSERQVQSVLTKDTEKKDDKFIAYIQESNRFTKNSLAQLYINFNDVPALLKNIIAGKLNGELAVLNRQNAFASLSYNFSKDKVLLTGTTLVNDQNSYYNLFSSLQSKKITIQNILPATTSSYTIFAIDDYAGWREKLNNWFLSRQEDKKISQRMASINTNYHLNLENIFPRYFKDQLVTFQLSTSEKIGAISLTNGDKMMQLLLDLSEDYNEHIKTFKEADLLYAYFGLAFSNFKKPYYSIIDNYMVFANNAGTLERFLNSYRDNQLLISNPAYVSAGNQLPENANIIFYVDHHNSSAIFQKQVFLPYYKHLLSEKGLKKYESFTYHLSGDKGKFQTNILINKQPEVLQKDSLAL
ncbi:hypothetical protein [Pedobacter africanus]|uniref:DUF3352 domain-containing protein n=1 Tax=Pedobacter africanus TaxID=151894 RepID=A0A1W2E1E9_9SPHI|nr:hypothetical protein [Pedobacter africanus]SMD03569.1 hypothetical protein SAMN04488524_4379 [Pedobacter africanus]